MTRWIVGSSMKFRPLVVALAVIVMMFGITRLGSMPVDVFPEILPTTVSVQTEALGLSAAEVEQLITVPIEADLLAGTPWVETMRSESVPGLSSIEMVFKPGTNPMHARQMVQERLTQAHALPNVSKPPQMLQPLSSTNRVMLIGLSSKTESLIQMSVQARWTIRPRLMGVPGVANVAIWGQRERQLQVQVDPEKLRDNKVTLSQIIKTTGNSLWYSPLQFLESNVPGTGGFVETPNQRLGVRHLLPITVAEDLAKVPVEGAGMPLGKVANVIEDHQPLIGDAMNGGTGSGLLLVVEKLPGVNTLKVTDDILAALEQLKPGMGGIEFDTQVYRPANYIRSAINNVASALLIALILMAVALLVLLYDWRAAVVGLVTIPLSLISAVLVMYASGATINMMVLAGLVIALGVVIDDGIIDADNFLRRLRRANGASPARVLLDASFEMRSPLVFATAIVLLVALPTLFMTGPGGAFVKPMIVTYVIAVLASLVVATTVTPALALMLFRNTWFTRRESPVEGWLKSRFEGGSSLMPRAAMAVAILGTIAGLALLPQLNVTTAPTFKETDLLVHWDARPGTSRSEMNRLLGRVSAELRSLPGVRNVGAHVGRAILSDQVVGISSSELWVSLDPKADYEKAVESIGDIVGGYPGVDADVMTYLRSRFGDALSGVDEEIVVRLYGQEQQLLTGEAEKVRQALAGINGIVDPHVEVGFDEPVVEILVDLDAARVHGVKPGDVRRAAATLLSGIEAGSLFEEQKVFEVVVWGVPQVRHSVAGINNLLIDTPRGGHVRLGDVASVRIVPAPKVIHRENVARRLDVAANISGRSRDAVAADVRAKLQTLKFPLEYRAELQGDFAEQQRAQTRILWASVFAALGVILLLQAAFESWRLSVAMLLTLPMALAGGVITAVLSGSTLSLGAMAGFLTVLGLAVRHTFLLVSRYRDLRRQEDMEFGPALVQRGTGDRAAAILSAVIVTAVAVLPFAILGGRAGHEILGPMAWVILGGLFTTTLYALFVVPALFARFGADAMPEASATEDLEVAV